MEGWIKLHRKLLENPIVMKDKDYLAVWIYLLLNATHKEIPALFKNEKIVLQKGQLITGRLTIAKKLKISESKVKRILKELESDQQIDRQRSTRNSLVSIVRWEQYQESDQQNDQQVTTNKNVINNINIYSPSDNRQESSLAEDFEKIWHSYPRKEGKGDAYKHYKSWLKGRKYAGRTVKLTNKQMWYAVKKYAEESKEKEKTFIKMGSTFFAGAIMDYVEAENE